jgi:hypothetical protein
MKLENNQHVENNIDEEFDRTDDQRNFDTKGVRRYHEVPKRTFRLVKEEEEIGPSREVICAVTSRDAGIADSSVALRVTSGLQRGCGNSETAITKGS